MGRILIIQKILLSEENHLVYVADTDNNQIVMLNLDGQRLRTRSIKHPVAIAQDYRLNLIVCAQFDTLGQTFSAVYKIDLVASNHDLATAPMRRIITPSG